MAGATSFPPDAILRINEQLATLLNSMAAAAPTTEPVASNVVWRDSGVLTVSVGIPPVITLQPQSQTVDVGDPVTFTVTATNATSYQWRRGGVNISGATSASYAIAETVIDDNGALFDVVVTGPGGTITSEVATITVEAVLFELPGDFTNWNFPEVAIYRNGLRSYTAEVNTAALTPTTDGTIYVNSSSGNDVNSGASSGTAVATLDRAIVLARGAIGVSDDFNRANQALTISVNWTQRLGSTAQIVSNQLVSASNTHQVARYETPANTADQQASVDVVTLAVGGNVGVVLRCGDLSWYAVWCENDTTNTYRVYYYDGVWNLLHIVNTTAPVTPFNWRGTIEGGVIKGYVNDAEVISHTLASDPLSANRRVGIYLNGSGRVVDNFEGGDLNGTPLAAPRFLLSAGAYTLSETLPPSFAFERNGSGVASVSAGALITPAADTHCALIGIRSTTGWEFLNGTQLIQGCIFENTNPSSSNAIHLTGTGKAAIIDTEVVGAGRDGISGRNSKQILELRCTVHDSGPNESDNASTMHTSSRAVRIDGDYYECKRVVHDVNSSQSVNLGCRIYTSTGSPGEGTSFLVGAGFSSIGSESVKMWLYGCDLSQGGATDDIYGDTDTIIYIDIETLFDDTKVSSNANIVVI